MARKPLSKSVRFKVFKRDDFTCQYCGRKPPAVILEADHVLAVKAGGENSIHNLITACFDCNRGKGSESLLVTPIDLGKQADLIKEKKKQVRAYERMLAKEKHERLVAAESIGHTFERQYGGFCLTDTSFKSIERFLEQLPYSVVLDAMERACIPIRERNHAFKYFCGTCWRLIKGNKE